MAGDNANSLVAAVTSSRTYQNFQRAFTKAVGLPICFSAVECWQLSFHGKECESPLCSRMATDSRSCTYCLQVQQKLSKSAMDQISSKTCGLGLVSTAIPVRVGSKLIGFLQTGEVLRREPTEEQLEEFHKNITREQISIPYEEMKELLAQTKVVPPEQYEAIVGLLSVFAEHIALICNQILLCQQNAEPPAIQRAKEYIQQKQCQALSLGDVARAVNTSTFHFCKMFCKTTGLTFTDYVSRVRIEKAKNLLLNPNLRISEIAYEVGFQSLTHFNRVFKKVTGKSPTDYRAQIAVA